MKQLVSEQAPSNPTFPSVTSNQIEQAMHTVQNTTVAHMAEHVKRREKREQAERIMQADVTIRTSAAAINAYSVLSLQGILNSDSIAIRHEAVQQLADRAQWHNPMEKYAEATRRQSIANILQQERSSSLKSKYAGSSHRVIQQELGHCGITMDLFPVIINSAVDD